MTDKPIYFDNAATTKISESVLEAMMPYLTDEFANPGSIYRAGLLAKNAVDEARHSVAKVFHCDDDQVIFTSGGSEGNNLIIYGLRHYLTMIGKSSIAVSAVEHDSVLGAARRLLMLDGFSYAEIPVTRNCEVLLPDVEATVANGVGLTSVMYVNNETGVANDVAAIAEICKSHGTLFHTDCVQAAGSFELDTTKIGCDFATISSHKIKGPKGVGAVFARNKTILNPIISGGKVQEFGYRGGTENVAGIVGFGRACEEMIAGFERNCSYVAELRNAFASKITQEIPYARLNCFETGLNNAEKIISITLPGVDTQTLILMVGDRLQISAGSACTAHNTNGSHVLIAMGMPENEARSTIRISLSSENTIDEVERAIKIIAEACGNAKRLSAAAI